MKLLGRASSRMAATMSGASVVRLQRQKVHASSATAKAMDYSLQRGEALTRSLMTTMRDRRTISSTSQSSFLKAKSLPMEASTLFTLGRPYG